MRLGWAESKLDKAAAALTKARLAVDELDAEYERRREELYQRIHVAEEWYRWRQQQLDELHDEAAQRAPSRRRAAEGGEGAEVRDKIRDQLLPQVQLVMEHLEGNPEILDKLSVVAAGLVDAESRLEARPAGSTAERFYMAEGDDDERADDDTLRPTTDRDGPKGTHPHGGASGDHIGGKGKTAEWRSEGPGRWSRAVALGKTGVNGAAANVQVASDSMVGQPKQEAGTNGGAVAGDHEPGGNDDGMEDVRSDGDGGDDDPSKRRQRRRRQTSEEAKEEARLAADKKKAEELQQQQAAAIAAQVNSFNEGAGGFGSDAALSHAAQAFVLEVQRAQERAAAKGIVPKAEDGRALLQLAPLELRGWIEKNLGDEEEL